MKKLMLLSASGVALVLCALNVSAKEVVFNPTVPNEDGTYCWTNGQNWVGGAVPAAGDIVVFSPSDDLTVKRPTSGNIGGMRFESGNTTLTGGGTGWGFGFNQASNEIYVAESATARDDGAIVANRLNANLYKTGKGTITLFRLGGSSSGNNFNIVDVTAGVLNMMDSSPKPGFAANKLKIRTDATFYAATYSLFSPYPAVVMESGSTFRIKGGSGSNDLTGLSGAGEVVDLNYQSPITIKLPSGADNVFSGTFNARIYPTLSAASAAYWVLGATNVLQNAGRTIASRWLSFLPGLGDPFVFGSDYRCNPGYPLHLADTNGGPVTVIAQINPGASTFEVDGPGSFYVKSGNVTLTNSQVRLTGTFGVKSNTTTLCNGTEGCDFDFSTISGLDIAGGTLEINNFAAATCGAKVYGGGTLNVKSPMTFGDFRKTSGANNLYADTTIAGGDALLSALTFSAADVTLRQTGGVLRANAAPTIASGVSSARLVFDGGLTLFPFASSSPTSPFSPASGTLSVGVGKGGATFRTLCFTDSNGVEAHYGLRTSIGPSIVSAAEGLEDGGIRNLGYPYFTYFAPLGITGPFSVEGSLVYVAASANVSGSGFFGSGGVVLRNGQLAIDTRSASETLTLCGVGSALTVGGGSMLHLRSSSSAPAQAVELPSLSFEPGGVLILRDNAAWVGADGASSVKVTGDSVPVSSASGRVLANVFAFKDREMSFLGYDASRGFVPLDGVVSQSTFNNVTSSTVLNFAQNSGAWYATPDNGRYAVEAMSLDKMMTVQLGEGTTLSIGDGMNDAVLAMEQTAQLTGKAGSGVSFGTSRGVVVVGGYAGSEQYRSRISAPITAANGLYVMGMPDNVAFRAIILSGANTYSGGTSIGAACVYAQNERCFSHGDVTVLGGERHGGQVRFALDGGVWTNRFRVAGTGIRHSEYSDLMYNGALSFKTNGTVAGAVELSDMARFAAFPGVSGVVSGVVSGDRLEVAFSKGVVELDGANPYTGGTRVAHATLALGRGDSAGTGAIELEGGTLRFVNDDAIVFTNDLSGTGRIEFAGRGTVTLAGAAFAGLPFSTFGQGAAFDWPSCGNATWVMGVDGALDLGGSDVTVDGISGSGRVSGGTVTVTGEIRPGGEGAVGTISFERAPVFSGATLVAEIGGGEMDRIEVDGSASLAGLSLRVVELMRLRTSGSWTAVSATEALAGDFESVVLPERRKALFSTGVSGLSANVSFTPNGTYLIIF